MSDTTEKHVVKDPVTDATTDFDGEQLDPVVCRQIRISLRNINPYLMRPLTHEYEVFGRN